MRSYVVLAVFITFALASSPALTQENVGQSTSSSPARTDPHSGERWAVVDGEPITRAEVEKPIADELTDLYRKTYELQKKSLDRLIERKILDREARKRGITTEQLIETEIKSRIQSVTEEEVARVYSRYRTGRAAVNLDKDSLYKSIYIQKYYTAMREYLDVLGNGISVEVLLEEPRQVER